MKWLFVFVLAVTTLHDCNTATAKRRANSDPKDDVIHFPNVGPKPESRIPEMKPSSDHGMSMKGDEAMPPECRGKNYCTVKPADYPEKIMEKLFPGTHPVIQPSLLSMSISNRQGDPDERNDCNTTVTFEPLYRVKDETFTWRDVVQAPKAGIVQKVRLERCEQQNSRCFKALPESSEFTTMCKQLTNLWEVKVLTGTDKTETITTELPVCCSCHYKSNF